MIANVLTIAGTDPTGGAGIQADIKTFSALGAYAMSAITAVVAQNTQGVRSFVSLEPEFVADQVDSVFDDVRVDAVKIGMVATARIAETIADRLRHHGATNIVLDPVMVAKSGDHLLEPDAVAAVLSKLVPLSTVITPNLPEAGVLLGVEPEWTLAEMRERIVDLHRLARSGFCSRAVTWAAIRQAPTCFSGQAKSLSSRQNASRPAMIMARAARSRPLSQRCYRLSPSKTARARPSASSIGRWPSATNWTWERGMALCIISTSSGDLCGAEDIPRLSHIIRLARREALPCPD